MDRERRKEPRCGILMEQGFSYLTSILIHVLQTYIHIYSHTFYRHIYIYILNTLIGLHCCARRPLYSLYVVAIRTYAQSTRRASDSLSCSPRSRETPYKNLLSSTLLATNNLFWNWWQRLLRSPTQQNANSNPLPVSVLRKTLSGFYERRKASISTCLGDWNFRRAYPVIRTSSSR